MLVITKKYYMHPDSNFHTHTHKHACKEITIIPGRKLCSQTAGYATHPMKQIQEAQGEPAP